MFRKKILIIDDSELMVRLTSDILSDDGYDVVVAGDGASGMQKVREEKPDLVILDVVMPGMSGFEVCKALREDESNNLMPILILTSQDNENDKLTGLELGADDYIIKPFNRRELLSRVKNTLLRIDRNRWANPLTGLQGNLEIQSEITSRIAKNLGFAVIYADLDNFKAYNDVYGFACGDRAIKLTADIIMDNVHMFGTSCDFIGHIGGDDFIIVTSPQSSSTICEGIIRDFDLKIPSIYTTCDRLNGYIATTNRHGQVKKFPIMSISIAIVSNKSAAISNHLQVAEIAADLKKKVKSIPGSTYLANGEM